MKLDPVWRLRVITSCLCRQLLGQPCPQCRCRGSSHLLGDDLATLKEDEGGNRLGVESPAQVRRLVDVDLDELQPSRQLPRKLLQDGTHSQAGTAPGRPQIDKHWDS